MRMLILTVVLSLVSGSTRLLAQVDSPKAESDKSAVPLIEFRKAWYEKEEGRVASNFKQNDRELYLEPKAQITAADVKSVKLEPDQFSDRNNIRLELTEEGAKKMRTITKEHLRKPLAILVRGEVLIAPEIREQISGQIMISGLKSEPETQKFIAEIQKQIDERD